MRRLLPLVIGLPLLATRSVAQQSAPLPLAAVLRQARAEEAAAEAEAAKTGK